ncbi:hypothetical protein TWF225_002738 [Orbilia oligospora]|nr:hypothetical protein TWF225_002738 [Orbilia oligospora]KAF3241374.1 hypothetical protein TWF217_012039 [Orbilia oligospora]KAF3253718.1 hypothetical protein TWF128_006343 [Orbilia oligospora]
MSRFLDTLAFEWAMVVGTIFLVILRLYHRNRYAYITLFEDGFVVVAWLCFLNQVSLDTVLYDLGFFNEESGVVAVGVDGGIVGMTASKIFFVKNTTYHFCMYAAKTAILCFYTRLVPETMKKTRVCLWITVATVTLGFFTSILLDLLLCMPISRNWNPNGNCSSTASSIVTYFFHLLTDVMVYILPVSAVRVLVLPTPQRIGVGITFAFGFLCIAFAATVIVFRYVSISATTLWMVAIFEQTLCVCVACAPALEGLARGCDIRRWKGRMSYNRGKNQDTDSEAGTIDAGSRPQSDATIFDQTQNHNLERAPKRVESLLGQEEIEKPHLCRPTHILPKISPVAAYNRQSHDTECQANSPNSPGYTMSISSIVDFYDLERQLQLDDEKRQATNCSPVLERASSELHQGSNPSLPINLWKRI